ncbi:EamA family transporter [Umezawaea sp. Da 62-37]|uniref:EamA family transporter n=1 Tax=Umezawaea sp. Da 62-37 TaxID=3075927 RepID=UPI0028F6CDC6|nr:EamA family transporter [Umezawaea sp. Da 62-37]WNV87872.1 EamA family transporter [Umezawaea sp. Da 62-37]
MGKNRLLLDSGLTALAPAIWGSTYLVTTQLLPPDRPLLAATVRALPAGLVLLALGRVLPTGLWWWRALVLGTLNIGAFFFLLFVAAYHLPGGVAALVGSVQPVLVLFFAALLLRDRVTPVHLVACVLSFGGVALLVLKSTAKLDLVGVAAALGGAVCMAAGIVLTKRWKRPVGVLLFTGWQLTAGGLVLLPVLLLVEGLPTTITTTNALGFGYLIVFGSLFGYSIWFRGTDRLPAIAMSFLGFVSPIVATVLGYVFLTQKLTIVQLLGALILIGAIALVQFNAVKQQTTAVGPLPGEPSIKV